MKRGLLILILVVVFSSFVSASIFTGVWADYLTGRQISNIDNTLGFCVNLLPENPNDFERICLNSLEAFSISDVDVTYDNCISFKDADPALTCQRAIKLFSSINDGLKIISYNLTYSNLTQYGLSFIKTDVVFLDYDSISSGNVRIYYEDEGNRVRYAGNSRIFLTSNNPSELKPICKDSDGKDYYTKGKIIYINNPNGVLEELDSCADSNYLIEKVCNSQTNYLENSENYYCKNGCKDGACIVKEEVSYDTIYRFYNTGLSPQPLPTDLIIADVWTNKEPSTYSLGEGGTLWVKLVDGDGRPLLPEEGGSVLFSFVSDAIRGTCPGPECGWKQLTSYTSMGYNRDVGYYVSTMEIPKDISKETLKSLRILVDVSNGKNMIRFVGGFIPVGEITSMLCGNGVCEPFDEIDEGKNICPEDCPPSKYFVLFGGESKTISSSSGETHLSLSEVRVDKVEIKENEKSIVIPIGVTEMLDGAFIRIKLIGTHSPEGAGTSVRDFYAIFEIVDEGAEEIMTTPEGEEGDEMPFIPTPEKGCASGCLMNNGVCVPFGTRAEGNYCDISKQFLAQKKIDGVCENSYECKSNECSNGKCISTYSLLEKILDFLKNLFKFK